MGLLLNNFVKNSKCLYSTLKKSSIFPSEARAQNHENDLKSCRARGVLTHVVLAACELGLPIYIYLFVWIYISLISGLYQHPVWHHAPYVVPVHGSPCVSFKFYLSSVKEIFILSVNHKQIPSMQMTHKSKHSDSGFKKWIQILTRENFSGATSDHEMKFSASNEEDNNKNRNKKPRSLCPAKKPSTTDWGDQGRGYSDYRHIKKAVFAVFFRCLYIQFNSIIGLN